MSEVQPSVQVHSENLTELQCKESHQELTHLCQLWILVREMKGRTQEVASINGFLSLIGCAPKNLTTIGYYSFINAPITDEATIQECFRNSNKGTYEAGQTTRSPRFWCMHESLAYGVARYSQIQKSLHHTWNIPHRCNQLQNCWQNYGRVWL